MPRQIPQTGNLGLPDLSVSPQSLLRDSIDPWSLLESLSAPALLIDAAGGELLGLTRAFCRRFGWDADDLLGMRPPFPWWRDDDLGVREAWQDLLREGRAERRELHLRDIRGESVHVLARGMIAEGPRRLAVVYLTDITGRVRAESALAVSEARLRAHIDAMHDGVVVHGADGRITEANPAACRILGRTLRQILGRDSDDTEWDARDTEGVPLHGDKHPSSIAVATGMPVDSYVMSVQRPGGERVWVQVSAVPVPQPTERSAAVASFTDITALMEAEAELRERDRERAALARVALSVAQGEQEHLVLGRIAEECVALLGVDSASVLQFTRPGMMRIHAAHAEPWTPIAATVADQIGAQVPIDGRHASTEVLRTGELAEVVDYGESAAEIPPGIRSAMAAPITVDGALWGTLTVMRSAPGDFDALAKQRLSAFADLTATAVASAVAHERLSRLAVTDHLTGLANRRGVMADLERMVTDARRRRTPLSLLMLDVDDLKRINDAHGHHTGDRVLQDLARIVGSHVGDQDLAGRYGGDELLIALPGRNELAARRIAERIRGDVLMRRMPRAEELGVSIGISTLDRAGGVQGLLVAADRALLAAKRRGRNQVVIDAPNVISELADAADLAARRRRGQVIHALRALARAVDAKDHDTREHSARVADISVMIARMAGWAGPDVERLREAALLHDVGKIGVPDAVLFKPGRLTTDERSVIQEHAALGAAIVEEVLDVEQTTWVRGHHERFSGGGYPDGLAGERIPLGARILCLADSFDVMTTVRSYKEARSFQEADRECRRCAGDQFDPVLVRLLSRALMAGALVARPRR